MTTACLTLEIFSASNNIFKLQRALVYMILYIGATQWERDEWRMVAYITRPNLSAAFISNKVTHTYTQRNQYDISINYVLSIVIQAKRNLDSNL